MSVTNELIVSPYLARGLLLWTPCFCKSYTFHIEHHAPIKIQLSSSMQQFQTTPLATE